MIYNQNYYSVFSPKIGGPVAPEISTIKILDVLPLSDTRILIIFSNTKSKLDDYYKAFDISEYQIVTYYCKILDIQSQQEINTLILDESIIHMGAGNDQLTYGVKAQIVNGDQILITWLKAEIEYGVNSCGIDLEFD